MRILPCIVGVMAVCLTTLHCRAQRGDGGSSLCALQQSVEKGAHEDVIVSGIYHQGLENRELRDSSCPDRSTWVEFDLRTTLNESELQVRLGDLRQAAVEFEGEFYGPPPADPNLPVGLQKTVHSRWGHLGCCETKIIVHAIRNVKAIKSP